MAQSTSAKRIRLRIGGRVQGVGFRPFVHRLAAELALTGWVRNTQEGVVIEVEGGGAEVQRFQRRLADEAPSASGIGEIDAVVLPVEGDRAFVIRDSDMSGQSRTLIQPDIATCDTCLADIADPGSRRFRYPFTNCTQCGPRFSIIEALPYDRGNTTMRAFRQCPDCLAEYRDPADRRFHAQPNACPVCGPSLELVVDARVALREDSALRAAAELIRSGAVVAVKGIGGFHLVADALNAEAVAALRQRKRRPHKPFAVMVPDLSFARDLCHVGPGEEIALTSRAAPIVLLTQRSRAVASGVAPDSPRLGVMLPYTPLHRLLLDEVGGPVVATSGNLGDEPICVDNDAALAKLAGVADAFLIHDRPIGRAVEDSVVQVVAGQMQVLRLGRGLAPAYLGHAAPITALGAAGHLKTALAWVSPAGSLVGPHIGDLSSAAARMVWQEQVADLGELHGLRPERVGVDRHPGYATGELAAELGLPTTPVQHHHAHAASALVELGLGGPELAVVWDGTGDGGDGTVWGGEWLSCTLTACQRVANLRAFALPGGEHAVREPLRSAVGVLTQMARLDALGGHPQYARRLRVMAQMTERGINSPVTTSAGRLFDAVAAILGLCEVATFEGQAAMALQYAAEVAPDEDGALSMPVRRLGERRVVDWEPAVEAILAGRASGMSAPLLAARFHNGLVDALVDVAVDLGAQRLIMTGGCFQNRLLMERAVRALMAAGIEPLWPTRIPVNDGGLALGQAAVVAATATEEEH